MQKTSSLDLKFILFPPLFKNSFKEPFSRGRTNSIAILVDILFCRENRDRSMAKILNKLPEV